MKTTLLSLTIAMLASTAMANEVEYNETMAKTIDLVYKAQTNEEIQLAVNVFDRIGNAEKSKWEPFYYAAFGYIMMANREKEPSKKDPFLDQAKIEIDKATAITPDESEVVALEGFINMIRVTVDPATRGQRYSGLAMQAFGKALTLNPENPRALALMAQMQFGTAHFFKSSTVEACTTLAKADEKFTSFKTNNPLSPQWGKGMVEGLKSQCK